MSGNLFFRKGKRACDKKIRKISISEKNFNKWKRNEEKITKDNLVDLYVQKNKSMQEIATLLHCSHHKIVYWMGKYHITRRKRSDAMYAKYNPNGDPFSFHMPQNKEEAILFGMGIGLYWGEGTKANKASICLGNTDPALISIFIRFLVTFFHIKKEDMKFNLQIFNDINSETALDFWTNKIKIKRSQCNKVVLTKSGSIGTYRKKSEYGVLTVMYHNVKLRNKLIELLPM